MKLTLKDITSDDLEDLIQDFSSKIMSPSEAKRLKFPKRLQEAAALLQGKVRILGYWDWKENDEMDEALSRKTPVYKYAYNAYPGGDGTLVILSKVKLPKAETVY